MCLQPDGSDGGRGSKWLATVKTQRIYPGAEVLTALMLHDILRPQGQRLRMHQTAVRALKKSQILTWMRGCKAWWCSRL